MEFRILGPVEVLRRGRVVPLGGSRERAVLALLLASANRVVSAERLTEDLWAGEPPDRAVLSRRGQELRLRAAAAGQLPGRTQDGELTLWEMLSQPSTSLGLRGGGPT